MSTRVNGPESPVIESRDELVSYLESGSKPEDDWRIGTEHEKFGYCKDTLKPLPYDGPRSIKAMIAAVSSRSSDFPFRK